MKTTQDATFIELFAGAGGLLRGCAEAGMRCLAAVESDHMSCETLRMNAETNPGIYPDCIIEGDVRAVDWARWRGENVDVLTGGPPCQPFSLGGKAQADQDCRDMFPAMTAAIAGLMPKAVIIENVGGLLRPRFNDYHRYILARLAHPRMGRKPGESMTDHLQRLTQAGESDYSISETLVDAADYGIPQRRKRIIIIACRRDLGIPAITMPKPTHSAAALAEEQRSGAYWKRRNLNDRGVLAPAAGDAALLPWVTARDALTPPAYDSDPMTLLRPSRQGTSYPGHTGSDPDLPSKTIKAGVHGVPGGENMLQTPQGPYPYSVRDAARIQTFPDDVMFSGSRSQAMRQVGNAVPVKLARIAAGAVVAALQAETM